MKSLCHCRTKRTEDWWKGWPVRPTLALRAWTEFRVWRCSWRRWPTKRRLWKPERGKSRRTQVWYGTHVHIQFFVLFLWRFLERVNVFLQFQQVTQLQKEMTALHSENQSLKKKFEVSTNEAKGESCTICGDDFIVTWTKLRTVFRLVENFDQIKRILVDEKEHEARLRKWVPGNQSGTSRHRTNPVTWRNGLFGRIAENNIEILRQDHDKEVESLKEELKRLKEEKVGLHGQVEEAGQANSDLQEQVIQLSKHVKLIPELNREINSLQNQRNNAERKMKQQSEQARGTNRKSSSTMGLLHQSNLTTDDWFLIKK